MRALFCESGVAIPLSPGLHLTRTPADPCVYIIPTSRTSALVLVGIRMRTDQSHLSRAAPRSSRAHVLPTAQARADTHMHATAPSQPFRSRHGRRMCELGCFVMLGRSAIGCITGPQLRLLLLVHADAATSCRGARQGQHPVCHSPARGQTPSPVRVLVCLGGWAAAA